ncbi:hypothetical protein VTI74DRAFT_3952 [Chaetomium olivicolor]
MTSPATGPEKEGRTVDLATVMEIVPGSLMRGERQRYIRVCCNVSPSCAALPAPVPGLPVCKSRATHGELEKDVMACIAYKACFVGASWIRDRRRLRGEAGACFVATILASKYSLKPAVKKGEGQFRSAVTDMRDVESRTLRTSWSEGLTEGVFLLQAGSAHLSSEIAGFGPAKITVLLTGS